jgi:hypothetical protein
LESEKSSAVALKGATLSNKSIMFIIVDLDVAFIIFVNNVNKGIRYHCKFNIYEDKNV